MHTTVVEHRSWLAVAVPVGQRGVRVSVSVASVSNTQFHSVAATNDATAMFGFFRKNAPAPQRAPSSSAPSTAVVTTAVTTDVTAPVTALELTAERTTAVTADVTTEVTTSTVATSRIVENWAEPKPFPPPEDRPVQFWPCNDMPSPRAPSAKQLAEELLAAMQGQPMCAGQWVLAFSIE
jgi:hypothetical protein